MHAPLCGPSILTSRPAAIGGLCLVSRVIFSTFWGSEEHILVCVPGDFSVRSNL